MKAVILSAGKGERLEPLTKNRPKPLFPIAGRPLLEWLIKEIGDSGIKEVLLITNYMENEIKNYFGDGSEFKLKLTYLTQKEMKGTADAFRYAENFVGEEDFLGIYGDLYLSQKILTEIVKIHHKGEFIITGLQRDPYMYGALKLEGDNVKKIIEKPPQGTAPSNITNAGIYIFPNNIFKYIKKTELSSREEYEITDSINLMIDSGVNARLHMLNQDEWLDIGYPWVLLEANNHALAKIDTKIEGQIEENVHIQGKVQISKTARIRSGVYIEGPAYIGPESDVGPNSYLRPGTVLTKNVRVGAGCEIKNSIILAGSHIPHLSYVGDSIIGERCNLGAGTIVANLRFDKKNIKMSIKGKRTDTGLRKFGAILGDDVETGVNVSIYPGVKIGNGAWIAPGMTVSKDVPDEIFLNFDGKFMEKPKNK
ncbi:glucose-1-phosphate thymidylyltransferase [Candidatus Bathyarchaeota archaeon]|nr:glucose-1-phosphate thymidylyltransferase [Candidatus Bathyarchaeota archaeon]